jgi:3-deoxy-D-manno-octulosonic-acid transferase
MIFWLYHSLTKIMPPLLKLHLKRRLSKGKEDPTRLNERFGGASFSRPSGKLIWFHAASVGESVAILPLVQKVASDHPVLVTTGTVTSARVMQQRLPKNCWHQFVPFDVPQWVGRFLDHWQPDIGIFVESELWPNLLFSAKKRNIPLILVNARMSGKSYRLWRIFRPLIRQMLRAFRIIFVQDKPAAHYYSKLGGMDVRVAGNLKFAADPLPYDAEELKGLRKQIGKRPVWAAVSTHAGEEIQILAIAQTLKAQFPNLLTILVPRHPERTEQIISLISSPPVRRTANKVIREEEDLLLWDTMGEVGLVYRLVPFCFIGGSLVPIGGHNPIEALLHGCYPIIGPHVKNCATVVQELGAGIKQVSNQEELGKVALELLKNPAQAENSVIIGQQTIQDQQHKVEMIHSAIEFLSRSHG